MSSGNPYASGSSPGGYRQQPKNNKKKWLIIGGIIAALIIIGAVLGGVLGTQLNKGDSSNSGSGNTTNGNSNTGVPSGISNVNTGAATATGANGQAYLAIQTDSYHLPVYATGVGRFSSYLLSG